MSATRPSPNAYAALTDFIADPSGHGLPLARRMALRMTARIPDAEVAAGAQEELCARLEALVQVCNLIPDFMAIDEAQENAREVLDRCQRLGTQ